MHDGAIFASRANRFSESLPENGSTIALEPIQQRPPDSNLHDLVNVVNVPTFTKHNALIIGSYSWRSPLGKLANPHCHIRFSGNKLPAGSILPSAAAHTTLSRCPQHNFHLRSGWWC